MTSSSSLYGSVSTQNVSSTNSTSLYGEVGTPIPDSSGNVVVRGDLLVLSGNILTTAATGNIFPANATTINLGGAATAVNIGASTGTTTINNALAVGDGATFGGDITATGADFGNITIGVADDQTITTTSGRLVLKSTSGEIDTDTTTILSTNSSSFNLLNSPTTVNAFEGATSLTMGQTTGTTTIRNDLVVPGATAGNIRIGITDNQTIDTTTGELRLSSTAGSIRLPSVTSITTDTTSSFGLLNQPTTVNAFLAATSLNLGATTGTTDINNSLLVEGDFTLTGTNVNLAQGTNILYSENNNRANRPQVKSTTGNSSGFRVIAPNATTSATSTLTAFNTNDNNNGKFIALQARGALTDDLRIFTGKYTAGVFGASGSVVSFVDNVTTYATVNPAGPTNATDLTTKAYVDAHEANTTYTIDASSTTGGANFNLVGSDLTTDTIKFASAGATTVSQVDANTIQISSPVIDQSKLINGSYEVDLNSNGTVSFPQTSLGTYARIQSPSTTDFQINAGGGVFGLNYDGSLQTPYFKFPGADGTANQVLKTNGSGVLSWYSPSDLNTTYTYTAGSTSGGANLTLTGSDSSINTVKVASGTGITVAQDSSTQITVTNSGVTSAIAGTGIGVSGATGAVTISNTGVTSVAGTTNQVNVSASTGAVTFSLPQDINSGAAPTFVGTNFTGIPNSALTNSSITVTGGTGLGVSGSPVALGGTLTLSNTGVTSLAAGTYLSVNASTGAVTVSTNATDAATPSTIVARDASGNFSASGATLGAVTVGVDTDQTVSTTSGNLILQTAAGASAGTLTLAAGANGNITVAPNGTGNLALTASNGGNLTNTRNYVFGAIRNSTTQSIGDIWAVNSTGPTLPYRGVSLDNSADTTKGPGTVLRTYSGGAVAGTRGRLIFEKARGTAASPTALQAADIIGSIDATGYTSTGWVNDNVAAVVPAFFGFSTTENWVSNTNLGTTFNLTQAPNATTITSAANLVPTISSSPQGLGLRSDSFGIGQGKTTSFTATGCSTSGSTLTIGTVTSGAVAVGQLVQTSTSIFQNGTYIVSGSGSTWTLSTSPGTLASLTVSGQTGFIGAPSAATTVDALADLRLLKNAIKNSAGTTCITTNTTNVTFALPIVFPNYTAAALRAITGAIGWQAAVSDSASGSNPNGMMAFWDTTNARWSYVHDNSAV